MVKATLHENVDYELIPGEDDHWNIRIKKGEFIETVFNFGKIRVDEKNHLMKFDFTIQYSPDPDLNVNNNEFQKHAAKILESVILSNLDQKEEK
jgi:hypothetical protein|tara:strand:- start:1353 stop:1634 length:282 start_codon:yes stop_codon:yes gene_type:complete